MVVQGYLHHKISFTGQILQTCFYQQHPSFCPTKTPSAIRMCQAGPWYKCECINLSGKQLLTHGNNCLHAPLPPPPPLPLSGADDFLWRRTIREMLKSQSWLEGGGNAPFGFSFLISDSVAPDCAIRARIKQPSPHTAITDHRTENH